MKFKKIRDLKLQHDGKKIHKLNKNILLMNIREVTLEILYLISKNKKMEKLDERLLELISEFFSYGRNMNYNFYGLVDLFARFESDNVKKQIVDLYFEKNEINAEILDNICFEDFVRIPLSNNVKIEQFCNKIKNRINLFSKNFFSIFEKRDENGMILYKTNPFILKLSSKYEDAHNEKYKKNQKLFRTCILKNQYEEIDFSDLKISRELIFDIFDELDEERKADYAVNYIETGELNAISYSNSGRRKVIEYFKDYLPREILLEYAFKTGINNSEFSKEIQITDKEILEYFKENWVGSEEFEKRLEEALKNTSIKDVCEFLDSIDVKYSSKFYHLFKKMQQEKIDELENCEYCTDKIKNKLFFFKIKTVSDVEKIQIFNNLDEEKQIKLFEEFYYSNEFKTEEYNKNIVEIIKDENLKEIFKVFYITKNCSVDEFLKIVELNSKYKVYYSREFLLNFSDDELKTIYEKTTDEILKKALLKLNRKKDLYFSLEYDSEENLEIEEYNKKIPNSILINKDNIKNYMKNANFQDVYKQLFETDEFRELEFSEILDLYNDFKNKKNIFQMSQSDQYDEVKLIDSRYKEILVKKADFKELYKLFQEDLININDFERILDRIQFNNCDCNKYLLYMEKIEEQEIKQIYLEKITKSYLNQKKDNTEVNIFQIYKEKILSADTTIENKYLYLGALLEKTSNICRNSIDKEQHKKSIEEIKDLFVLINKQANKNKYNEIFNFEPIYEMSPFFNHDVIVNNYSNYAKCLPYLNSEKVYQLLQNLYKNNAKVLDNISKNFLNEDIIESVDYEIIEYLSRYGEDLNTKDRADVPLTDVKIKLFIKAINRLKQLKSYPEEDVPKIIYVIKSIKDEKIEKIDLNNENKLDILLSIALQNADNKKSLQIDCEEDILEEYKNQIKENARKDIHSKFPNRRKILNAIGKRFFNLSYIELKILTKKYGEDLQILYNRYLEKVNNGNVTLEEENEFKALTILRNLKELINIKDKDALIKVFDELDQKEEYQECDFSSTLVLEDTLKKIYSKDYINNSYVLNAKDKKESIDGIDVYSPIEFKMFVHVVAAFGEFNLEDKNNSAISIKDKWNNFGNVRNHILCTSYIGNDYMCYAGRSQIYKEQLIFGFSSLKDSEILMASNFDIGSYTDNISSKESVVMPIFRIAESIINKCRFGHNEVCIERRLKSNKNKNIEPEYIVCFDEINELSKKAAKDFNIPIVLINKFEVAKHQSETLDSLIQEFYKTKNPKLLNKIINLFQSSKLSFGFNDNDYEISEEFFSTKKMNKEIEKILSIIETERKIGNKQNANDCYIALYEAFEEEIKLCKGNNIDIEEFCDPEFKIRSYLNQIKQIIDKNKIVKENKKVCDENVKQNNMYKVLKQRRENENRGK